MRFDCFLQRVWVQNSLIILKVIILKNLEYLVRLAHHIKYFIPQLEIESNAIITQMNREQVLALRQSCIRNSHYLFIVKIHARKINMIQQIVLLDEFAYVLNEFAGGDEIHIL